MDIMSAEISESSVEICQAAEANEMMSFWMQFFRDAGIMASDVENYSVIFINHRIQKHMLLDLNKEYLIEMGITAMGDIIAILKQAKAVQSKSVREAAQKVKPTNPDTLADETPLQKRLRSTPTSSKSTATATPRSTPASRMVGHHLGNDPGARLMSDNIPKSASVSPELAKRLNVSSPESANRKSSVFSRLGTGMATQSTPRHSLLGFQDDTATNIQVTVSSASSQISDLRGVLKRPATTTCHDTDDSDSNGSACEYAGVLKKSKSTKKPKCLPLTRSMTRDSLSASVQSEGILSDKAKRQSPSVKHRLGQKQASN